MSRVVLFYFLQVVASAYAITRGGAPERLAGGALLAAAFSTLAFQSDAGHRFVGVEYGILSTDLVLLAALLWIAASADRWWTLWIAALHALGTGAHLVRFVDRDVLRFVYALLTAAWSYPIVLLLVVGTMRHRRRLQRLGVDRDWSRVGALRRD